MTEFTVFYTDDDEDDLSYFKEALDGMGVKVRLFQLPELLLHTIENPPPTPSLLFVDLNMPVKNGFDVMAAVRARRELDKVPIVVYTTSQSDEDIKRSYALGANLFMTKQSSWDKMIKSIKYALEKDWGDFSQKMLHFVYNEDDVK